MREEVTYLWRIKWGGRWTTSSIHYTEESVRKEHPEATVIDGSRKVRQVPDTPEELAYAMFGNPTGGFLHPSHLKPPGTTPDPETQKSPRTTQINVGPGGYLFEVFLDMVRVLA